jgi:hypothetical protein
MTSRIISQCLSLLYWRAVEMIRNQVNLLSVQRKIVNNRSVVNPLALSLEQSNFTWAGFRSQ